MGESESREAEEMGVMSEQRENLKHVASEVVIRK